MIKEIFRLYSDIISPITHFLGKTLFGSQFACRFQPSCSEYSRQAFQHYGIIRGAKLSLQRIVRCHPFSVGGYDPIPDKIK